MGTLIPSTAEDISSSIRLRNEYQDVIELPAALGKRMQQSQSTALAKRKKPKASQALDEVNGAASSIPTSSSQSTALTIRTPDVSVQQTKPDWHPPWKLYRVISGHLGWVRSLAVEPDNQWFASGSGDRVIKVWDMASGTLKLSLTGHIGTIHGLAISSRHPYLFSVASDKMCKMFDLERNVVTRHYHGHLSGIYAVSLHPTLDILATAGRDGCVRVWDVRSRANIMVLSGHKQTITDVQFQEAEPQIISSSLDGTVRLYDLAAGKTMAVLTHFKKGVRSLALHPKEFTFAAASTGIVKQFKCPEGAFMSNFEGHNTIINTIAVNEDNVMVSGGDDGSMAFFDWKTGHRFQMEHPIAQPGSLDAENGILCSSFDKTGLRCLVGGVDKTIKLYKPDDEATQETHPLQWRADLGRQKY